jgi:hypothetical protein
VEPVEEVIARRQQGKQVPAETDTDATIEDAVFSMVSAPRLYSKDQREKLVSWCHGRR